MPRHEADREDLIAEATALRRRAELRVPGEPEPVIAGFRSEGQLSLYFGSDPTFQFDRRGRLRRAFVAGRLYRTQGTTLARLTRERAQKETVLKRHDLSAAELSEFLEAMRSRINNLQKQIDAGEAALLRQIPPDVDIRPELAAVLQTVLHAEEPLAPAIRGKR